MSSKQFTVFTCDNCGTHNAADPTPGEGREPPKGWLSFIVPDPGTAMSARSHHLCPKCRTLFMARIVDESTS